LQDLILNIVMKMFALTLLFSGVGVVGAFIVNPAASRPTMLTLGAEKTRVEKAGAGIPIVPPGNNSVFDPNKEGKLGNTNDRIQAGVNFLLESDIADLLPQTPVNSELMDAQHWLEDIGLPLNFAKPQAPATATVLGRTRLIGEDAPGDIQHVILELPDGMHYVEGQSISIIPPGTDPATGRGYKPRLYSIASTRYGDLLDGNTVSLCVRRAEYVDPVTNRVDTTKAGVCSNFLCNSEPGTQVQVAGPVGKTMLLPEDPSVDIIMVATGTGIAPFRSFMHRLFMENTVARHMFSGNAWLILGVPVSSGLLYPEEFSAMQAQSSQLQIDYAISREMTNAEGGKLYVQHVLAEKADVLLEKLEKGAHIYFCGLKGMMPGILDALEKVCQDRGLKFDEQLKTWKAKDQWHVEVY
jgi:ferredoxin--NADP+ reductase